MPITKEHAEFAFRDYLGETVLDRLWNYFSETDRDILKEDFGRGFECGRYNTQFWRNRFSYFMELFRQNS